MSRDDEGVLEAARAIRPYLRDLLGPEEAAAADRELARILADGLSDPETAIQAEAVMDRHEDTAWFLRRVVGDSPAYRPPWQQPAITRGITSPAGDPGFINADRYTCPYGDYVWYRPAVGTPTPNCPDHRVALTQG